MRSKLVVIVLSAFVLVVPGCLSRRVWRLTRPRKGHLPGPRRLRFFAIAAAHATTPTSRRAGLNLDNYGSAMQGGGSGKVIEPGDAENSTLFQVISHKEEPKMPPNSPKIPDAELEVIRKWIEGGALENSGSKAVASAKPKFEFKLDPAALASRPARRRCPRICRPSRSCPGRSPAPSWRWPQPLGAAGRRRRAEAGAALPHDRLSPGRRAALSRRGDLRPEVQPQRRPAPGRRRPGRPVGNAVALGRQEGDAGLRGRQGIRRRAGGRHQPRPRPGRAGRARARSCGSTTRPTARWRPRCASTPMDHRRRVQPGRRAAGDRRPQRRAVRLGSADRPRVL